MHAPEDDPARLAYHFTAKRQRWGWLGKVGSRLCDRCLPVVDEGRCLSSDLDVDFAAGLGDVVPGQAPRFELERATVKSLEQGADCGV